MYIIIDEMVNINGRNIHYKVASSSKTPENRPYLLCVQGGPGFSSLTMELAMAEIEKKAKEENVPMPNVIFYDPVGCGSSDKPEDIAAEYTMTNYTEMAASVVEAVKATLSPQQPMDLRLYGSSFGAMTVMDLPMHRPQWLDENADIRLRQITANVCPNGADTKVYGREFLEKHYVNHPEYQEMRTALDKIYDGTIKDHDDYLHCVFSLAPLYSDSLEKTRNSLFGKMLMKHPHAMIAILKTINKILKSDGLAVIIEGLTGNSLDVSNQFFGSDFGGFNLTEQVADHLGLYSKVPICLIASANDHTVDPMTSLHINELLGNSSAAIILNDKHQANRGPNKAMFMQLGLGLICKGHIPEEVLTHAVINQQTVTEEFQRQLSALTQPMQQQDSTSRVLSILSRKCGAASAGLMHSHVGKDKEEMTLTQGCGAKSAPYPGLQKDLRSHMDGLQKDNGARFHVMNV